MCMAELFEVQGTRSSLPYNAPFGPAVVRAMTEMEAGDSHLHGNNLRSAAGNGMHVVAVGHVLLFVLAAVQVVREPCAEIAAQTFEADLQDPESQTQSDALRLV